MAQYIVELGNNRQVADSMKSAVRKAVSLADTGYAIQIWQIVKGKIKNIGTVALCNPQENKNKLRPITIYFKRGKYGMYPEEMYPAHKDGSLGSKIDILSIKWHPYFPHIYYLNDRMSDAEKRKEAVKDAYYRR